MFKKVANPGILTGILTASITQYSIEFISSHCDSSKREIDFRAGRHCVSKAFESLGVKNPSNIGTRPNRTPDWPRDWVGSITHTDGFASAAIAKSNELRNIGIDSEKIMSAKTAYELDRTILTASENALWENELRASLSFESFVTLIFSAKESAYKCLNPLTGIFFDFQDINIFSVCFDYSCFDLQKCKVQSGFGRFSCSLLRDLSGDFLRGSTVSGGFEFGHPFIHSAVAIANI